MLIHQNDRPLLGEHDFKVECADGNMVINRKARRGDLMAFIEAKLLDDEGNQIWSACTCSPNPTQLNEDMYEIILQEFPEKVECKNLAHFLGQPSPMSMAA